MTFKSGALAFVLALLPMAAANAQTPLGPPYGAPITLDVAKRVAAGVEADAKKNGYNVVIVIVDSGCNPVLIERMGTGDVQLSALELAQAKAVASVRYRRATKIFRDSLAKGGDELRFLTFPNVITSEGGELLMQDGKIIGAIGISGAREDEQAALAGVAALAPPAKK